MAIFNYLQMPSHRGNSLVSCVASCQCGCVKPLYWRVRMGPRATLHVVSSFCISVWSGDIRLIPSLAPDCLDCNCPPVWACDALSSHWDNADQSIAMIPFCSCWNKHTQCSCLACIWDLFFSAQLKFSTLIPHCFLHSPRKLTPLYIFEQIM